MTGEAQNGSTRATDAEAPTDFDWAVRTRIYETFAESGRAPVLAEVAAAVGGTEHQIRESLQRLFTAHEIAPLPSGDGIWMANPFSGVPTDYSVETADMTCYSPCAWDSLGVASILQTDIRIHTRCAQSGAPLEFGVEDGALTGASGVIHLVTPIGQAWDDIGFT